MAQERIPIIDSAEAEQAVIALFGAGGLEVVRDLERSSDSAIVRTALVKLVGDAKTTQGGKRRGGKHSKPAFTNRFR